MHFGTVDSYNFPKRGKLGSIIFVSGGLRSRYPLFGKFATWEPFAEMIHLLKSSNLASSLEKLSDFTKFFLVPSNSAI